MSIHHALQIALASQPRPSGLGQGSEVILGGHLVAILQRERSLVPARTLPSDDGPQFRRDASAKGPHLFFGYLKFLLG